jgi:hypothetical protein
VIYHLYADLSWLFLVIDLFGCFWLRLEYHFSREYGVRNGGLSTEYYLLCRAVARLWGAVSLACRSGVLVGVMWLEGLRLYTCLLRDDVRWFDGSCCYGVRSAEDGVLYTDCRDGVLYTEEVV